MSEQSLGDYISGIRNVPPAYPVKPTQPGSKDRDSGKDTESKRKRAPAESPDDGPPSTKDGDDTPSIDEYV